MRKQSRCRDWTLLAVTFMLAAACGVAEGPVAYSGTGPNDVDLVRQLEVTPGGASAVTAVLDSGGVDAE